MRTTSVIREEMRAILDQAEGRSLTDDEVETYEGLEAELQAVQRDAEVRARERAYRTPATDRVDPFQAADAQDDQELRAAFRAYLTTGQVNHDLVEARALEVGTNSEGGYLVPSGFLQRIIEVRDRIGGLAAEVETITTADGRPLEFPSLNDTANSGEIVDEEGAAAAGADLAFGTVTLGAFRYTTAGAGNESFKVSVELLQDSTFDVEALIARAFGRRLGRKQASDWAVGGGTTLPFGICHAGLTADKEQATSGTFTYQELLDVEEALDEEYLLDAKWVFNSDTWAAIRALTDSGAGRPLVLPQAAAGIGGAIPRELLGYPVIIDNGFPDAANNTPFAVLGSLREAYLIRRVSGMAMIRDPYTSKENGQVEFTGWERADGNIQNRSAYAVLAGATV